MCEGVGLIIKSFSGVDQLSYIDEAFVSKQNPTIKNDPHGKI